jgi:hypothetical protein
MGLEGFNITPYYWWSQWPTDPYSLDFEPNKLEFESVRDGLNWTAGIEEGER